MRLTLKIIIYILDGLLFGALAWIGLWSAAWYFYHMGWVPLGQFG